MSRARIVVVEDDPQALALIEAAVRPLDAAVHFAARPKKGLDLAMDLAADVVLMSADMPGALSTFERMKSTDELRSTPLVVMSRDLEQPLLRLHREGPSPADRYVQRPLQPRALYSTLTEYLGQDTPFPPELEELSALEEVLEEADLDVVEENWDATMIESIESIGALPGLPPTPPAPPAPPAPPTLPPAPPSPAPSAAIVTSAPLEDTDTVSRAEVERLEQTLEALQEEFEEALEEAGIARQQLTKAQTERDEALAALELERAARESLEADKQRSQAKLERHRDALKRSAEERKGLERQLALRDESPDPSAEADALRSERDALAEELEREKASAETLVLELERLSTQEAGPEPDALAALEAQFDTVRRQRDEARGDLETTRTEQAVTLEKVRALEAQVADLTDRLSDAEADFGEDNDDRTGDLPDILPLTAAEAERLRELEAALEETGELLLKAERDLDQMTSDRDRLQEALATAEAVGIDPQALSSQSIPAVESALGDPTRVDELEADLRRYEMVTERVREAFGRAQSGIRNQREDTARDLERWAQMETEVGLTVRDLLRTGRSGANAQVLQELNLLLQKLHEMLRHGSEILQHRKAVEDALERLLDQVSAAWRQLGE